MSNFTNEFPELEVNKIYATPKHKYVTFIKITKITKMYVFYKTCDTDGIWSNGKQDYRQSINNFKIWLKNYL